MNEANAINGSLLFLEMVIVALHENARGIRKHIPYRNGMLTSILKDSLGGNCKTSMIANISIEAGDIDESISTLNFSQRVALIQNVAKINEESDPSIVIKRLKKEIEDLKCEIKLIKGIKGDSSSLNELSSNDRDYVENMTKEFMFNSKNDPTSRLVFDDNSKVVYAYT